MKKQIILKSANPKNYPDLVIECLVIPHDQIKEYLSNISDENKFYAFKNKLVQARRGVVGEVVKTTLKTIVDGKEYYLVEVENTVQERTYTKKTKLSSGEVVEEAITAPDMVITNYHSPSNEQYIISHEKFASSYTYDYSHKLGFSPKFRPNYDSVLLTQVDENVIIITSRGTPAVCLVGSYIVTNDEKTNSYSVLEKKAFESTYEIVDSLVRK